MEIIEQPYGCFICDRKINRYDVIGGVSYDLISAYAQNDCDFQKAICDLSEIYYDVDLCVINRDLEQLLSWLTSRGYSVNGDIRFFDAESDILKPVSIEVEITTNCNLACSYCYASAGNNQKRHLSLSQWISILNLFYQKGARVLTISGGEPLLYDGVFDLIENFHRKYIIVLDTNGCFITAQIAEKIFALDLKAVQVSLDSPTSEIHDKIRGAGAWQMACDAIHHLRKCGVPVILSMVLHKLNASYISEMEELAYSLGCEIEIAKAGKVGRGRTFSHAISNTGNYGREYHIRKSILRDFEICCFSQVGYIAIDQEGFIKPCNMPNAFFDTYSQDICKFSCLDHRQIDNFMERHTRIFNPFYTEEQKPSEHSSHNCIINEAFKSDQRLELDESDLCQR